MKKGSWKTGIVLFLITIAVIAILAAVLGYCDLFQETTKIGFK